MGISYDKAILDGDLVGLDLKAHAHCLPSIRSRRQVRECAGG